MSDTDSHDQSSNDFRGIRRKDPTLGVVLDGCAGRVSVLGFGHRETHESVAAFGERFVPLGGLSSLGNAPADKDSSFAESVREAINDSQHVVADSIHLCPSADEAVELAIRFARCWKQDAYRIVSLIGSDHGRTIGCRTASGRPELREGLGPLVAGFSHVTANDIEALEAVIDEQTACVLLSPVDLLDGCHVLDQDYLQRVRELCDEHQLALIVDETKLSFGATGKPFSFAAISDIRVDGAILSAGVFAGLAGGIFVGSEALTKSNECFSESHPLQQTVALVTLTEFARQVADGVCETQIQERAVALAEVLGGYEFIRDLNALGMTFGIETDIPSDEIIETAKGFGFQIEPSGETAVRMQLPLLLEEDQWMEVLEALGTTLQNIESRTSEALANE